MIDCTYVSVNSWIMWEIILRHLSVEKLELKRSGKNVLSWTRPPLFENNMCQLPSPRLNKQTLRTLHLLFACILSLDSIWLRVVFILQDKIFCREWNEVLIWNGALTGAGTREIMFLRAALWQVWRGGSHSATWLNISYNVLLFFCEHAGCRFGGEGATLPHG